MATDKAKKKTAQKPMERLAHDGKEMVARLTKRAEESMELTRQRGLVLSVIELEKATFDHTFKLVDRLQKQTEDVVKEYVEKAEWMPQEGRTMVEEWTRMLQQTRKEFLKTVDKSFVHVSDYIKRIQDGKETPATKKPAAAKKAVAAKKATAARKPAAAKKPATARAGAKSTARKSGPGKPAASR